MQKRPWFQLTCTSSLLQCNRYRRTDQLKNQSGFVSAYHSAFEGVLETTSLMKLKDLCHHIYHNLYDGNWQQQVILTQQKRLG